MDNVPTFKLILLGNSGTGKSSLIRRHMTGEYSEKYNPTMQIEINSVTFSTSRGIMRFNIFDIGNFGKCDSMRDIYYLEAHCAIIMFDISSILSYIDVSKWFQEFVRVRQKSIPIVVCGNKWDLRYRMVLKKHIKFHRKHNVQFYPISVKTCLNYEKPFLWLMRRLVGDLQLKITPLPAKIPAVTKMPDEVVQKLRKEMDKLLAIPLTGNDECL